jgi:NADP-dependent 3-hydroxy acid dehydrogenase YdfG
MHELSGKSAVLTGASRGIGEAAAHELAAAGVNLVLVARSADAINSLADKINAGGGKAVAVTADVSNYEDINNAVKRCESEYGSIDILINNAGVIEPIGRLADTDPAQWSDAVDVNFKGVYYGARAALPPMLGKGGGIIVNVSSGAAVSAIEGWSQYCSSKAGALSLTRMIHKEYADQGIHVVGLSPGTVATEMQALVRDSGINPVSQLKWEEHIPAQWAGQAIVWLCTKEAVDLAGDDFSIKTDEGRRRVGLIG